MESNKILRNSSVYPGHIFQTNTSRSMWWDFFCGWGGARLCVWVEDVMVKSSYCTGDFVVCVLSSFAYRYIVFIDIYSKYTGVFVCL